MLALFMNGEPFVNNNLIEMIAYAKKAEIAERIFIVTNGAFLSKDINVKIAQSGLDEMLISVEALSSHQYEQITGTNLSFDEFVSNISDFNDNKGSCKLFVKMAMMGNDSETERKFHDIFDNKCDLAYTELIIPIVEGIDYNKLELSDESFNKISRKIHICPRPFFSMGVHPNGEVSGCTMDYCSKLSLGNVSKESLVDIWNGKSMYNFRMKQLNKLRYTEATCDACTLILCDTLDIDILDDYTEKLLDIYERGARF